ncbi:hypothetical protein FB451DRAFT_1392007 [Mycena latifolia]|nr:hypothetical protein FB451DRAFT_1392007 [Mycena latifolia]
MSNSLTGSDPAQPFDSESQADSLFIPEVNRGFDSDPITAPPAAKRAASESINDSDDSADSDAPPAKKPKKHKEKAKEKQPDPDRKLILFIPQAGSDGTQRKNLTHTTSFEDVLDIIYEIVGCNDVAVKPKLSYKLPTSTNKAAAINLSTETDWEGCLEEVTAVEFKKRSTIVVSVRIIVTEQYLASLLANKGKSSTISKKKGKIQILDLEHAGSGDDDFDDGVGIMGKEAGHVEQLQKMYSHCQMCGPTKICKINASGTHQPLTNNQIRAWARALAAETHGVTLQTPPKAALFAMFFKSFGSTASAPVPMQPEIPFGGIGQFMGGNPFAFMPPWMQGMPPAFAGYPGSVHPGNSSHRSTSPKSSVLPSSSLHASTSSLPSGLLSSDPPDMDAANPYPEIADFISALSKHHPKRNLTQYIHQFDDLDFYNIDEILKLQTAEELTRVVGVSTGNASFLLAQVKAEMKRVDRIIRTSRG